MTQQQGKGRLEYSRLNYHTCFPGGLKRKWLHYFSLCDTHA